MSIADDLVERFEPWINDDLETYLRSLATVFSEVELLAMDVIDEDGNLSEGWTILFDPDLCPSGALPYLAQYVGEILPLGLSEPLMREQIKDRPHSKRGRPQAMFQAAQKRLTGNRLVSFIERADGVVDKVRVITYTSQTPDPAGTLADIQSVTPADVILDYQTLSGQTWQAVKNTYATWNAVKAANLTWAQLATGLSGTETYVRPQPT